VCDNKLGLNVDLMSYILYKGARKVNTVALLDQQVLFEQSQATFSLLFQNFVASPAFWSLTFGSQCLLVIVREKRLGLLVEEDSLHTQLGWFIDDADGNNRWGIEVLIKDTDRVYMPVPADSLDTELDILDNDIA
jgi:hypothetical protein